MRIHFVSLMIRTHCNRLSIKIMMPFNVNENTLIIPIRDTSTYRRINDDDNNIFYFAFGRLITNRVWISFLRLQSNSDLYQTFDYFIQD